MANETVVQKEVLYQRWSTGAPLILDGVKYRVGRMSYGDYFLEPGRPRGERYPFNTGTRWTRPSGKLGLVVIESEAI